MKHLRMNDERAGCLLEQSQILRNENRGLGVHLKGKLAAPSGEKPGLKGGH
jgi:hypothetical protein